ncbi:sensor domain-containing diguanylate cyclase [Alcaligenaceae bacterium CGII-47]|nr:sensor domain-containing diguanylate cyclase [Alcaligenaceae bacterium CGII-47]
MKADQHSSRGLTAPDTFGVDDFFDLTPMALWLEDYSELFSVFERWRAAGVTDLRAWFAANPAHRIQCSNAIRLLRVNRQTLIMYRADTFEEISARLSDILREDAQDGFTTEMEQLWAGATSFFSSSVNYTLDGQRLDISLKGVVLPDVHQRWDRVLVAVEDVTDLQVSRREAQYSARLAHEFFEQAPVSLWVEDFSQIRVLMDEVRAQGITDFRTFIDVHEEFVTRCMAEIRVQSVNRYTLQLFKAQSMSELLSRIDDVFCGEMHQSFAEQLVDLWEGRLFQQREVQNYALDGSLLHIHMQFSVFEGHEDNWGMVLLALTDITARKKAEAYLEYLGKHDVLTKLKSRSFYVDEINRLERKRISPVSIIALDLNSLKQTNDQSGHAAGDSLLRRMGEVLTKAIDRPAHAARIGGDEFMVLLPGLDEASAEVVLENIRRIIDLNNQFYGEPNLSVAMGAVTIRHPERIEDGVRRADLRMYEHKRIHHGQRRCTDMRPDPDGSRPR